ncbi:MAG TPA: alcohol dehydrogenase catalytic domain-containing protein [bacterium]|nr:alcohol dehydrogenase catalytic domain-containing protein [bacterium]
MGVESPATTVSRAIVYHSSDDLRLETVPLRPLARGELLVRIRACGLCSGEAMDWYMARKAPHVPGHEIVAEVVQAGEAVEEFSPGDRIFVHHHAPCMRCRFCQRGDHVHCETWRKTKLIPGGLSDLAIVPREVASADVLPLPRELSDDAATFVEPLACVVKAAHRAGVGPGDRILVIGLGVMGLLQVMLARRLGAELIMGADRVASRLQRGKDAGADVIVDVTRTALPEAVRSHTEGTGADVVVVGPGTVEAIELGFRCVAPGGSLVLFTPTPPGDVWPFPVHDAYFHEVSVIPSYSAGPPQTQEALHWLARGLPVETLITHRYPLEGAAEGYRLVREARNALKVVVHP